MSLRGGLAVEQGECFSRLYRNLARRGNLKYPLYKRLPHSLMLACNDGTILSCNPNLKN